MMMVTTRILTAGELAALKPCGDQAEAFQQLFPAGAPLTRKTARAWLAERGELRGQREIVLLACKKYPAIGWVYAGLAFEYAARVHPRLARYANNITPQNWHKARDAAVNTTDAADAAEAAYAAARAAAGAAATAAANAATAAAYADVGYAEAWQRMYEIALEWLETGGGQPTQSQD